MKLVEKFNDLKLAFKVIGWYKENKDIFVAIGNALRSLQSQVNVLKEVVAKLKPAEEDKKGDK